MKSYPGFSDAFLALMLAPVSSYEETGICITTESNQNFSPWKIVFVQQSIFIIVFRLLQVQSVLWESMAAIFRQSVGYVFCSLELSLKCYGFLCEN